MVVDAHHKADGDPVTFDEIQAGMEAAGDTLRPRDIVLVRTGRDAFYHEPDYMLRGCGVTASDTLAARAAQRQC